VFSFDLEKKIKLLSLTKKLPDNQITLLRHTHTHASLHPQIYEKNFFTKINEKPPQSKYSNTHTQRQTTQTHYPSSKYIYSLFSLLYFIYNLFQTKKTSDSSLL
jgi:hypothetical protein